MELYYVITISDRDRAEILANIYQTAGTGMVLTKLGRGTATGEQLSSYGLDATEKAIVSTVADAEQTRQIFKLSKRRLFIDVPGNGVMMAIPLKSSSAASDVYKRQVSGSRRRYGAAREGYRPGAGAEVFRCEPCR